MLRADSFFCCSQLEPCHESKQNKMKQFCVNSEGLLPLRILPASFLGRVSLAFSNSEGASR